MKVAIAGLGAAARRGHLPAISRLQAEGALTLVAAADTDPGRLAWCGLSLPAAKLFESAEEMLDSTACDILIVATDPSAHADLIGAGIARGVHVVCEKPLTLTRAGYECIAAAHAARPEVGLVPLHQYRYSPAWGVMCRWARLAAILHLPFSLFVDVKRLAPDALAATPWRSEITSSGGILADHGVHYLALAWTVDRHLEALASSHTMTAGGERAGALLRVGTGVLTFQASTGNPARQTRVTLQAGNFGLRWRDEVLEVVLAGRTALGRLTPSLADRGHVDALYEHFYRDLVRNLSRPHWRLNRAAEALTVGQVLLALLDLSPPWSLRDGRAVGVGGA